MSVNMKQSGNLIPIASLTKAIIPLGVADCYSEEERQVGCWIDGKPVYQKTINFGALPNNTTKRIAHNIANIDRCINLDIISKNTTSGNNRFIPVTSVVNLNNQVDKYITTTEIAVVSGQDMSAYSETYATIQYTKTTDTAGSGIWTPSGEYAEHYSTSEQVVGTWIDGKPIYRKSYVFNNVVTCQSQQWTSLTEAPASNISEVIRGFGQDANGTLFVPLGVNVNAGYFGVLNTRNNIITFKKFTIEYTKTTD